MLMLHMPKTFKIGDTEPCRINKAPTTVHWRPDNHLVLGGTDARTIPQIQADGDLVLFICGDENEGPGDHPIEIHPVDGGFLTRRKA